VETNCSGASVEGRILQRPPPLIKILRPPSRVRSSSRTRLPREGRKDRCHQPCSPCADDGHSQGRAAVPVDFHRDLEDSFVCFRSPFFGFHAAQPEHAQRNLRSLVSSD
jgi:hypothetical protein